jgi:drug/metabolite transporter (DMT)-like permease
MRKGNHIGAVIVILLGATCYGLATVAFKLALADGWSIKQLTLQQLLAGATILWLALAITRLRRSGSGKKKSPLIGTWKSFLMLIIIGVVGLSLTTVFYNEAIGRLDASLGIVLLFQYTWITILLDSIYHRRWPGRQQWIAMGCIAVGTILAVGLLEHDFSQIDKVGVVYGLLSAITYSMFFFLTGFLQQNLDPISKSAIMSTASFAFVIVLQSFTSFDGWHGTGSVGELIGWGLLIGLMGTAFPFFCFSYGIPKIGSGLAALLGSMELPSAVIMAFLLLDEPFSAWQGLGIALIILGIMAAQRTNSHKPDSVGKEGERQH